MFMSILKKNPNYLLFCHFFLSLMWRYDRGEYYLELLVKELTPNKLQKKGNDSCHSMNAHVFRVQQLSSYCLLNCWDWLVCGDDECGWRNLYGLR